MHAMPVQVTHSSHENSIIRQIRFGVFAPALESVLLAAKAPSFEDAGDEVVINVNAELGERRCKLLLRSNRVCANFTKQQ